VLCGCVGPARALRNPRENLQRKRGQKDIVSQRKELRRCYFDEEVSARLNKDQSTHSGGGTHGTPIDGKRRVPREREKREIEGGKKFEGMEKKQVGERETRVL